MKALLIIIVLLITAIGLQAQTDTTYVYHGDELKWLKYTKSDSTFYYDVVEKRVFWVVIERANYYEFINIDKSGNQIVNWKEVTVKQPQYIKDNRCNGIKADGTRCTRKVDNSKGLYFCYQHD